MNMRLPLPDSNTLKSSWGGGEGVFNVLPLNSSNVCLGILYFFSILSIEGVCVAALAPAVMTISGSTFHPLLIVLSISGLYSYFSPNFSYCGTLS